MMRSVKLFAFLFGASFLAGAGVFYLQRLIVPHHEVFGSLYRMFSYHLTHPLAYTLVVAFTFAVLGTSALRIFSGVNGLRKHVVISILLILTVVFASVPGGMLWKLHDMQAGFFPEGWRFWRDLFWGAKQGLLAGWLVALLSFPFNLIVFVAGYGIAWTGWKIGGDSAREK